jgi:general secretion pathway protein A
MGGTPAAAGPRQGNSMYLDYYGLRKEPFHITPDPSFFYLSPSHREALAAIAYGIEQRKGFVLMTGEVGMGKTTVLRTYLEQVNRMFLDCIYVFDPNLTYTQLLQLLLHEMRFETGSRPAPWLLQWFRWLLIRRHRAGRNVAVIIDEAQNMPAETLEGLRMISNLETTTDKLLQIVLVGQPELEQKLALHSLRQLRQRITLRATLRPLSCDESVGYLRHRVREAGGEFSELFTGGAVKRIVRHARGIPRTLNIVSGNALVAGFGAQKRPVTSGLVREVIQDLRCRPQQAYLRTVLSRLAPRSR